MKKAAVPSILVVVVLLAVAVIAEAQQPKKVPRIGFLSGASSSALSGPFFSRSRLASKTRSPEALKMQ